MSKHIKSLKKISKYLVASLILAVPLYPKFPFLRVPGTSVNIRLEDFLLGAVIFYFFIVFFPEFKNFLKTKIAKAIFIFLSVGLVSLLSAIFLTKTVFPHLGLLHFLRRIEYFLPLIIGFLAIRKEKGDLGFFLKVLMITTFIAFIYGVGQKYFSWPVIITQNQEYSKGVALRWVPGSHINSTFAGHYDLASFMVLVLPIFVSLFFLVKGRITKIYLAVVIFAGLWLLANAISRISVVSYLFAVSLVLVFIRKYKAIPFVLIVSIIIFALSSNLLARYTRIIEVTFEKIRQTSFVNLNTFAAEEPILERRSTFSPTPTPTPVFEDRSTSIRLNVEWPRAIRAFSKNPLLGTGYSSITLATDNDYLRLLGEIGILGFLSFLLIFTRIGQKVLQVFPFHKKFKDKVELSFVAGFFAGLSGIFINAVFIDIFEASKFAIIFWLLMGIALGLIGVSKK